MDWPKQARTADWESGVLRLDREKQFEVSELTMEIMERLAGYALVGFHVKGYPVTDELLTPFAAHKYMANFGVEDGALTDACFQVFSEMPKLRYLLLDGNAGINGSGLFVLQNNKLDLVALNRTGLQIFLPWQIFMSLKDFLHSICLVLMRRIFLLRSRCLLFLGFG